MSCDFKVGDEVECINAEPVFCLGGTDHTGAGVMRGMRCNVTSILPDPYCGCVLIHAPGLTDHGGLASRFRKVQRRNSGLTIESFSVIKDGGFEEPKRTPSKEKAKEKAQ